MQKLALFLASDKFEKLQIGSIIASVAAVSGTTVKIFVTMGAMRCFEKERVERKEFLNIGEMGMALLRKNAPLYPDLLSQSRLMGDTKVYACSLALDLLGKTVEEMVPLFDDVVGVATFLGVSEGAQVIFI